MGTIIIVDLDGTLANGDHRLHHLYPKETRDWDSFYKDIMGDTPHEDMVQLIQSLYHDYTIVIVTGRRGETRQETETWLDHFSIPYHALIMRPEGDRTDDHVWKPLVIKQFGLNNIAFVIEDRNRIVKSLREMGLRVLHVAEGDF